MILTVRLPIEAFKGDPDPAKVVGRKVRLGPGTIGRVLYAVRQYDAALLVDSMRLTIEIGDDSALARMLTYDATFALSTVIPPG